MPPNICTYFRKRNLILKSKIRKNFEYLPIKLPIFVYFVFFDYFLCIKYKKILIKNINKTAYLCGSLNFHGDNGT